VDMHYSKNIYVEAQVVIAIPYNFSGPTLDVLAADCAADPQLRIFPDPYGLVAKGPDDIRAMLSNVGDIASQKCGCCFDQFGLLYGVAGYEVRSVRPPTYCCKSHFNISGGQKVIRKSKCYTLTCPGGCGERGWAPGGRV